MIMKTYDYGTQTRAELYEKAKKIAQQQGITGISRYTKNQLADFIEQYQPSETATEITPIAEKVESTTPVETVPDMPKVETLATPKIFAETLVRHWKQSQSAKSEDDKKAIWQQCFDMCNGKQSELMQRYAESTVIKNLTPDYRKAIATEAEMLDPTVKGGYLYTAYPVAFWKVDQGARAEIDAKTKVSVNTKKKDATRVPVECREKLLSMANDLLSVPSSSAQDIWKKALAISLLTGRRFYAEVCRNAEFYPLERTTDFNRTLGFTGQAKGGIEKSKQNYELPTYAENIDLLIQNTELVQTFTKSKDWYSDDISAKDFQSKIKSQCELALRVFNTITMPYGFSITIKDLRALYMAFCYYDYKVLSGRHPDMDSYIGSIAGHDVTTESGGTYYRVGTTEHYKSFIDARWDN